MRIPTNSFTAADLALCRAHGDAVGALVKASDVREPSAADYNLGLAGWLMELANRPRMIVGVDPAKPGSDTTAVALVQSLGATGNAAQGDAYVSAKQPEPAERRYYEQQPDGSVHDVEPEPAADVWHSEAPSVAGVYETRINNAFGVRQDDGPRHFDLVNWSVTLTHQGRIVEHKKITTAFFRNDEIEWLRLIEADPAKPVRQTTAAHKVCIRPYTTSRGCEWSIGQLSWGAADDFESPNNWLPSDKDGWVTHEPRADSVCPVPAGLEYAYRLRNGKEATGNVNPACWRLGLVSDGNTKPSSIDVVAWRPTGAAA